MTTTISMIAVLRLTVRYGLAAFDIAENLARLPTLRHCGLVRPRTEFRQFTDEQIIDRRLGSLAAH